MRPSFAMILDWIDGRLDAKTARAVEAAVSAGGARSLETVRWLRRFKQVARQLPLEEPPPFVAQRLRQYFASRQPSGGGHPEPLLELRAELAFDSRANGVLAGMRGHAADDVIHIAYQTTHADLVVDIIRLGPRSHRLDGQLLPTDPSSASAVEVTVRSAGVDLRSVDGDTLGRFCLQDVPDGPIELRATNGEFVVIADLELTDPAPADHETERP